MIDIIYIYYLVLCESSDDGNINNNNNNNNNNNAPATDGTIGIIIGVVVAVVVLIVVLVVVTAVLVGVKVKRNRSTHHDSTPHGPSNTDVPSTCRKYLDTSHHIQYYMFFESGAASMLYSVGSMYTQDTFPSVMVLYCK